MPPQTWMVPRQKYDVIHYLREAYLKPHNPAQYAAADAAFEGWGFATPQDRSNALLKIAQQCNWAKTLKWITRGLATHQEHLNALLANARPEQTPSILEGMAEAFKGLRKVPKPEAWDEFVKLAAGAPEPAKAGTTIHRARACGHGPYVAV